MTDFADLARLHAEATPEPWSADDQFVNDPQGQTLLDGTDGGYGGWAYCKDDAALIAAARNAVPDFLRIREETLALHVAYDQWNYPYVVGGNHYKLEQCKVCLTAYPCPTVRIWNGESE